MYQMLTGMGVKGDEFLNLCDCLEFSPELTSRDLQKKLKKCAWGNGLEGGQESWEGVLLQGPLSA